MAFFSVPNLLSLSRVPLAFAMFWFVSGQAWLMASVVIWTAVISDVLDGYLARRHAGTTPLGGLLDHASDALFVTLSIAALTVHEWAPVTLAVIVPLAFVQYMLDSRVLSGRRLRTSQLGRYNGIAYFVFAGFPVMQVVLDLTLIPFELFVWIGWGLVLSTGLSMLDRLVTLFSEPVVDEQFPAGERHEDHAD